MEAATGRIEDYLRVGRSAYTNIALSLLAANAPDPGAILDFGCGAGRVTRWLRTAYPAAEITVADLNPHWVSFCKQTFNADELTTYLDLSKLEIDRKYNLIWVGSVVTHLSHGQTVILLNKLFDALADGGVLVVSTHGRRMLLNQTSGRHKYISDEAFGAIVAQALLSGYGYAPHRGSGGISLCTPGWLAQWCAVTPRRRILTLSEQAWDAHQDVVSILKQ
jgi:trans-aconitate methyltransferase